MITRVLSLSKDGHEFVFRYCPGDEGEILDELMRLADDGGQGLDWVDAATLGFQVAQLAAMDCGTALMAPVHLPASPSSHDVRDDGDSDDAKDGPCTNHNLP